MHHHIVSSKRSYPYLNLERRDDNIFFTALSIRIIKDFQLNQDPLIAQYNEDVFEDFFEMINGAKLYQFWKRQPNAYFPNGCLLHRNDLFKPPPETDTTGLIYYIKNHTSEQVNKYFEALRSFANTTSKVNTNSKRIYHNKKIFSTWFGSGQMPIEFDVVVLINTFYALEKYGYQVDQYYVDSIFFIQHEMVTGTYLKQPFYTSPWYANPVLIYYQVARFIYFHPSHQLAVLEAILLEQLEVVRAKAQKPFDHLLLDSAVMFLNAGTPDNCSSEELDTEVENYSFFLASMLTLLPGSLTWKLARFKLFHLRFICTDYNRLLVKENREIRKIRSIQG